MESKELNDCCGEVVMKLLKKLGFEVGIFIFLVVIFSAVCKCEAASIKSFLGDLMFQCDGMSVTGYRSRDYVPYATERFNIRSCVGKSDATYVQNGDLSKSVKVERKPFCGKSDFGKQVYTLTSMSSRKLYGEAVVTKLRGKQVFIDINLVNGRRIKSYHYGVDAGVLIVNSENSEDRQKVVYRVDSILNVYQFIAVALAMI